MKTMTCKQLGGACDKKFHANSFDEIAGMSKQHAIEMFQKKDVAHLPTAPRALNLVSACGSKASRRPVGDPRDDLRLRS